MTVNNFMKFTKAKKLKPKGKDKAKDEPSISQGQGCDGAKKRVQGLSEHPPDMIDQDGSEDEEESTMFMKNEKRTLGQVRGPLEVNVVEGDRCRSVKAK